MSDVSLVDLEVIKRYSLAIRQETAPADEVLAVLDASRAQILAALEGRPMRARSRPPSRQAYPELSDDRDFDEDDGDDDAGLGLVLGDDLDLDEEFDEDFVAPSDDASDDASDDKRIADPPDAPRGRGRRRREAPDPSERPVFAPRPWPSD